MTITSSQAAVIKAARRLVASWPSTRPQNAEEQALAAAIRAMPLLRASVAEVLRLRPGSVFEAEGKGLATVKQTHLKQERFWVVLENGEETIVRFDEVERIVAFKPVTNGTGGQEGLSL